MEAREEGYYWVKYKGKWEIAHWFPRGIGWLHRGRFIKRKEFTRIDERKIVRVNP